MATKKLSLAKAITLIGENEEVAIAKFNDNEEAQATRVAYMLNIPENAYITLSVRAHVAIINSTPNVNQTPYYFHKHWFTKLSLEAFEELAPESEVVKKAREAFDRREAKYFESKLSNDEEEELSEEESE